VPIASVEELDARVTHAGESFHVLVVPLKLTDGQSGVPVCLRCRATASLAEIPIIGVTSSRESAVIGSLLGAGADVVFFPPLDPEHLVHQVAALARRNRSLDEHVEAVKKYSGLKRSIHEAFNAVREGVLIFSSDGALTFINDPARRLLGISPTMPIAALSGLAEQCAHLLREPTAQARALPTRSTFTRLDGRPIVLGVQSHTIVDADATPAGVAVALTDLNELAQLAHMLEQDQRTRSLALLCAAGCHAVLTASGGPAHSIVPQIESQVRAGPAQCRLGATVTALLEVLDTGLNAEARVRLDLTTDAIVAARVSDIFLVLGHLILHSVARSGVGGETTVTSAPVPNGVEITVESELSALVEPNAYDTLTRLIHGTWSEGVAHRQADGTRSPAFETARAAAHAAGITLRERRISSTTTAYVITVPVVG
jgi:PAS domain-containing protein